MKKLFIYPFVVLLTACSLLGLSESYSEQLQQWIGRPEYQLYQEWGYPMQSFFVTPSEKVVTYVRRSSHGSSDPYETQLYYQGMEPQDGLWDKLFGPPAEKQTRNYYCKTNFSIRNGVIVNFSFNGDDCTADK